MPVIPDCLEYPAAPARLAECQIVGNGQLWTTERPPPPLDGPRRQVQDSAPILRH
jgi:hypothetical protein